ncbi:hypothetical protein AB833_28380 [Chromatiales bacterium (ex Bugula neritina AB1)]|nr:hypothetical protein AB833_28380 [Chromatiales bacterium (ex Bugula neritina AB1)]
MRNNKFRCYMLAGLCLLLVSCKSADEATSDSAWSEFYGTFKGNAESVVTGELSERELTVVIKPWKDKGFTVEWTTEIFRAGGKNKLTDLSIDFYPSARPNIFASAMRTDVFGQAVPYDPVGEDADPYVWAGLEDDTLTVSALYIVAGGGYEMHVYKRSLNETGLSLNFERLNNGDKVTRVTAQLESVE